MYSSIKSLSGALLLFAFMLPASISAFQQNDYLPLATSELGKPFKLKPVGDLGRVPKKLSIGETGAEVRAINGSLVIEGRDNAGKRWSVTPGISIPGLGGRLYIGDLDKNGQNDLGILVYTGGNGLAPLTHFLSVMIDSTGRPNFFEADGYFEPGANGFSDLVDMDGDGRADLIYMNFDDGYWITNIYKARGARWELVKGEYQGHSFPLYTRFTRRPNHKAVTPMRGRHPFAPNLSTSSPVLSGRVLSFRLPGLDESGPIELNFKRADGKSLTCVPDPWYSSFGVMVDSSRGREIAALGSPPGTIKSLLTQITNGKYFVRVFGQRRAGECSPQLIWAQASRRFSG